MKKSQKYVSIQHRLFMLTLTITACISIVFITAILIWQGTYYRKDHLKQLTTISDSAFTQVDNALNTLSTLSSSVAYSTSIQENYGDFFNISDSSINQYDSHIYYKGLTENLLSMVGPTLSIPQVYVYNKEYTCFGVGIDLTYRPVFHEKSFDFLDFSSVTGVTTFTLPHTDPRISNAAIYEKDGIYISALHSIKNNLNITIGYVEVIQRYKTIFASLDELEQSSVNTYAFTSDGTLVYPLTEQTELSEQLFTHVSSQNTSSSTWTRFEKGQQIYYVSSTPSGYIYVAVIDSNTLFSGFGTLIFTILGLFLPVIFLFSLICLQTSRSFSKPIRALCDSIENVDLSSGQQLNFPIMPTDVLEVSQLNTMIHKMAIRINTYMQELLLSQEQEIQTKILALQVQTNPHFIYNILFTISAMSASGMNDEIEELCGKIGKLMQYCSSSKDSLVSLDEELYYTSMYVECMRIRFPGLQYEVTLDSNMSRIRIPKLIVQLLVENAIKFCSTVASPWHIHISVSRDGAFYQLTVSDNGPGFSSERITQLQNQFDFIKESHILPQLELNGMGILNVYLRLLLIFGNDVKIIIFNSQPHGANVTIKIPIPDAVPSNHSNKAEKEQS